MHQVMILLKSSWLTQSAVPGALDVWLPDQDSLLLSRCAGSHIGLALRLSGQLCLQGLSQIVVQSTQGSKDRDYVTPQAGAGSFH